MSSYHAPTFKCFRGVTQGDPLSPTIFNMVIGTVLRHWIMVVVEEEAGPDGFSRAVRSLVVLFYTKGGLLESTRIEKLQQAFGALVDLFGRVGINTNIQETVCMILHT